jgi:hypothetical protein
MEAKLQNVLTRFGRVVTLLGASTGLVDPTAAAAKRPVLTTGVAQVGSLAQNRLRDCTRNVAAQS